MATLGISDRHSREPAGSGVHPARRLDAGSSIARAMLDEQMAGLIALSRYWDDIERTLYSSIEEESDGDKDGNE